MVSDRPATPSSNLPSPPEPDRAPPEAPAKAFLRYLHADVLGPEGAPPVLLLHGWGASAQLMRAAGAPLQQAHRLHILDLPGHGRTPPPPEAWGVPEYAALVASYLHKHDLGPLPVIGHSNGGRIALHMASDPEMEALITRLVLISPSGVTPERSFSYHLKRTWISVLKAPFRLLPGGSLRERGLDWLRSTIFWKLAASSDYAAASGVMRETFVRTVTHHLDDRLHRVTVPTVILWGDADTAVSRRQMEVLETHIPDAGLVVMEGAGHYGYLDAPALYAATLKAFLTPDAPPAAGRASP